MNVDKFIRETLANKIEEAVEEIRKTILHPDNEPNVTLYPKTSIDQVEQLTEQLDYIKTNLIKDTLIGKDGIVIDKAADSEKIEVSGKNFRKALETVPGEWKIYASRFGNPNDFFWAGVEVLDNATLVVRGNNGCIYTNMPNAANMKDTTVPNKKYVDDLFLKVYDLGIIGSGEVKIPGMRCLDGTTNEQNWYATCVGQWVAGSAIALTDSEGHLGTNTPTHDKHCVNKKYADDAIENISSTKTLYRHDLHIMRNASSSVPVFGYSVYCSFYSSSNLKISSLANLRTVLGNQFIVMATGYLSGTNANYDPVEAIFQSGVRPIRNTDQTYDNATFDDDVTKII